MGNAGYIVIRRSSSPVAGLGMAGRRGAHCERTIVRHADDVDACARWLYCNKAGRGDDLRLVQGCVQVPAGCSSFFGVPLLGHKHDRDRVEVPRDAHRYDVLDLYRCNRFARLVVHDNGGQLVRPLLRAD